MTIKKSKFWLSQLGFYKSKSKVPKPIWRAWINCQATGNGTGTGHEDGDGKLGNGNGKVPQVGHWDEQLFS